MNPFKVIIVNILLHVCAVQPLTLNIIIALRTLKVNKFLKRLVLFRKNILKIQKNTDIIHNKYAYC